MPRYVSPERTPSPSRSPSRSRPRSRPAYTDGVYTPTSSSPNRSRSRSRSRSLSRSRRSSRPRRRSPASTDDDYYSYSSSNSGSRSRSRSTAKRSSSSSKKRTPLASLLDTSSNTKSEKAQNVLKTSLVMLGAIGAASLAAHKFWPKGVTYGDKDDWEMAHEEEEHKKKGKDKDKKQRDEKLYLQDRYRERPRLPRTMDGEEGREFWERRERSRRRHAAAAAAAAAGGGRYLEGPPPPQPQPQPQQQQQQQRRHSAGPARRRIEAAPLPAAPIPPRSYGDHAPLVVPAGANRRESEVSGGPGGRYFIDGDTIVVPSARERSYVIQRDAAPGQRLRMRERDPDYYR